jgi:hypothetical protein
MSGEMHVCIVREGRCKEECIVREAEVRREVLYCEGRQMSGKI